MHDSFHESALRLARRFTHHKQVPLDVGYRWGKEFLQEAFQFSSQQWALRMFDPCPPKETLELWVDAFITQHKPLSRSTQRRFFWNQYFVLNEATLDPRPESEGLVSLVLNHTRKASRLLDLGTGSGCIILSLLEALPQAQGVGVDIEQKALEAAEKNTTLSALENRVQWLAGDWYTPLELSGFKKNSFDVIISNPPYVTSAQWYELSLEVQRWDPKIALDGGIDGIDPYTVIIPGAIDWLTFGGVLVIEIADGSAADVLIALGKRYFSKISLFLDHCGRRRYLKMNL